MKKILVKLALTIATATLLFAIFIGGILVGLEYGKQYVIQNQTIGGEGGYYYSELDGDENYYFNKDFCGD